MPKKNVVEEKQEMVVGKSFDKNFPNGDEKKERLAWEWKVLLVVATLIVILVFGLDLLVW